MWSRLAGTGPQDAPRHRIETPPERDASRAGAGVGARSPGATGAASGKAVDRRAYYRVSGMLPVRIEPLAAHAVEAAIFDLSIPDPLRQPVAEEEADSVLATRLRRIEEKLDLLLGALPGDRAQPLSGRDRKAVVFSGAGLRLEVERPYATGDAFSVEILLPPPYLRTLRAVGRAVSHPEAALAEGRARPLALALRHMEPEERDALIAYSYDLQRFALRHRDESIA